MTNNFGLYVHIPFCLSKCVYCDFVSYADKQNLFAPYVSALIKEIERTGAKTAGRKVDTVYFGGGTPTILPPDLTSDIMAAIKDNFNLTSDAEVTTEANPATIDKAKAEVYLKSGFNRISVGMQSADDKLLAFLGRAHNKKQFEETVSLLQKAGFVNINADFMLGLHGQTVADAEFTADYLAGLGVKHISAYSLILERGTPLYKQVKSGRVTLPDDDFTVDLYDAFYNRAKEIGFARYEVSNFSVEGYECRHNLNCWRYHEYVGVGASAHSFYNGSRRVNVADVENYINKMSRGGALSKSKKISREEGMFEFIMLGLRTQSGIDVKNFNERFQADFFALYGNIIKRLVDRDVLEIFDNGVRIKVDKFYILNSVITEFIV